MYNTRWPTNSTGPSTLWGYPLQIRIYDVHTALEHVEQISSVLGKSIYMEVKYHWSVYTTDTGLLTRHC